MKHISTIVNAILALVMILILLTTGLPDFNVHAATPTPEPQPTEVEEPEKACDTSRTIHVSGTAVVNVVPDRVLIQLGVQSNGKSPKEVQARNAATIRNVIKAVKVLGVEARDISTDWYIIEPLYEDYDSLHIKGYRIYNIVAITMRDVTKANDAIAAAFQAGANQVVNVEYYTSDLRKYRDQAREIAMKAASEKAAALSQAAGADTDCVLNINENTWSYFNGGGWWWYGGNNQNLWTQNAVQNVPQNVSPGGNGNSSGDESPVSTGHISIRAEVGVTFALK